MAHELESMFYYGDTPWHGLGVSVAEALTSAQAIVQAGLDWAVTLDQVVANILLGDVEQQIVTDEYRSVVRHRPGMLPDILGVVGKNYHAFQNIEAFDLLDSLVDDGKIRYHTAGSLRDGKRVWILAKLAGDIQVVGDDITHKYLLLSNMHDGSGSLRVFFTVIRVVCANTLQMAFLGGIGQGLTIRHTHAMPEKVKKAQQVLGLADSVFAKYETVARQLVSVSMTESQFKDFAKDLIPDPEDADAKRAITMANNTRDELLQLFIKGRGQELDGVRGTKWAALNAVTEFSNYMRRTKGGQENRLESVWFGSGDQFNQKAVSLLM